MKINYIMFKLHFTDADYADDIAILTNTPNQAETLLHSLERVIAGIGLHVNAQKTEYMCYRCIVIYTFMQHHNNTTTKTDLFRLLAVGMCHFLPVYYLGIVFLGRVEGQNITL